VRLPILAVVCFACAAPHAPAAGDPCSAGWEAFSHGDPSALAKYQLCERSNPEPPRTILPADGGLEAFEALAQEAAARADESVADRRRRCPRTTAIEEATYALRLTATDDQRGFRHYMAAACVDALVGQSAMQRSIHPCVILANPPPAAKVPMMIHGLEAVTPPACFGDPSPCPGARGWDYP